MMAAGDRTALDPETGPARLVAIDGSSAHGVLVRMARRDAPAADLADALHQLCALYGRPPGVFDHILDTTNDTRIRPWLHQTTKAFTNERAYLVRLTAAAGPPPSTPGQAATEAVLIAQRHAIGMLAQSARPGCAMGAASALALDWPAIRLPLDRAAVQLGIDPPPSSLPTPAHTLRLIDLLADEPATARAMTFGMQQLLAQHRGLWDLLDARAGARRALAGATPATFG